MTVAVLLDNLSFEADELVIAAPESHFDNSIKNPLTQKDYQDCVTVLETYQGVESRGFITRNDVARLHEVREEFPHLDRFFKKYPLNSFTTEASLINYEVSQENFIKTIAKAIINVIKATVQWIIDKSKAIWAWLTSASVQSAKVEALAPNLIALQEYISNIFPALRNGNQKAKFETHIKRTIDTQRHNLNRNWNGLTDYIQRNESGAGQTVDGWCVYLEGVVPGFISDTRQFLDLLTKASSENDVIEAIRLNTLARGQTKTNEIVKAAVGFGYNPNMQRKQGVTEWQAICQVVLGHYRGLSNDKRVDISENDFMSVILNAKMSNWSDSLRRTEKHLGSSIPDMIKELKDFDVSKLNPNLEDAYRKHLLTYLPALISTLQGFTHLQEACGLLISTRDTSVFAISKAALELAKDADTFVNDNFDSLSLSEQLIRKKYKSSIMSAFR